MFCVALKLEKKNEKDQMISDGCGYYFVLASVAQGLGSLAQVPMVKIPQGVFL